MDLGFLSRRSFLKLSALAGLSVAFRPLPPIFEPESFGIGRITTSWVNLHDEPSIRSPSLGHVTRDELITLLHPVKADDGPLHNPIWYRTPFGYAHSGDIQLVRWQPQKPVRHIPETGALFEVSVPYTRSYFKPDPASKPLYRLYYQSTAWIVDVVQGADGQQWYCIKDDTSGFKYYGRAEHFRYVPSDELTPISPDTPLKEKRIEVDLQQQELRAFEYDRLVLRTRISSGIPSRKPGENGIPTITPSGKFYVSRKTPVRHMGDGHLTSDIEAYELPGVPWVSFFHVTGVAFHGTYWHSDFGRPRSHGCVNMRTEEARWLYRWTIPVVPADQITTAGYGTPVIVS
ncbi:MAG: L,D-transpeptidase family protein [Anaerolineales bacterium]|nr:L,D-transpeptidase family protein [Anaerolineales bacterium]